MCLFFVFSQHQVLFKGCDGAVFVPIRVEGEVSTRFVVAVFFVFVFFSYSCKSFLLIIIIIIIKMF